MPAYIHFTDGSKLEVATDVEPTVQELLALAGTDAVRTLVSGGKRVWVNVANVTHVSEIRS
jgi:hypothetical protein